MADLITVYWRDIPAQVIVKKGRMSAKRELSMRFTEAIDMCAMRSGAHETDEYLAEWRRGAPEPVSDDLEAEADKAAARLEENYTKERLVDLVNSGGRAGNNDDSGGNEAATA
ncbi:virulence factor [Hoeflea sp.]|uniref:virulence factor n=1 Tax=Hoeflea sp. TaxID=1940281 RepID=UPI003B0111C7